MVIDTSAVLAILRDEPERRAFNRAINADDTRLMSVVSFVEASMVMEARQAFRYYGKGRYPAALNFGDCFTYALAKSTEEPLLFKGNDFGQTDIVTVQG
ncbi:type II toxin-antitoxin system VapC family toxin [Candidatus Entotheonella palauensis]|uniref:type II toxin-antitoxin system VapC family toxin n=1 Tax=Candidatus Entotheonella palauensis TaxID=93172 RepID=UPI000B7E863C|nr:type II toxin-antitoxin system VapC family toxin [Candidatus Entotheonella palauensis]